MNNLRLTKVKTLFVDANFIYKFYELLLFYTSKFIDKNIITAF